LPDPFAGGSRTGASGIDPPPFGESVFVADVADGVLDVGISYTARRSGCWTCASRSHGASAPSTTASCARRQKVLDGTLVDRMVLSIRAMIGAPDAGGLLGWDGLDVDVVFHMGDQP